MAPPPATYMPTMLGYPPLYFAAFPSFPLADLSPLDVFPAFCPTYPCSPFRDCAPPPASQAAYPWFLLFLAAPHPSNCRIGLRMANFRQYISFN